MGVFGVVFGCIGDAGFTLVCISGCRGVVGFNVVTSQLPVREKVRPARSDGGCEREKVRPACEKWPKIGGLWRAGRTFSRKSRWMGCAGRVVCDNTAGCGVLGEFFRGLSGGVGVPGEFCRTYRHAVSFSGTFGALVTGCARSYPLRNGLQAGVGGGFALHEALWLRVAGVSEPHVVQFPRLVSECEGCDDQSADRRGEKRGRWAASGEVVCVLGAPASVVACCSHVNPLLRAVTRYVARKPAILSVGGAAQVRISGPTCALAGPSGHLWDRFATWCQSASGVPSTAF